MAIRQYDIPALNLKEKIEFFGAFYNYIDASIPINTVLFQILDYSANLKIKNVVRLILKEIDSGNNFADVILRFKKPLGAVFCNLLSVGAQTGEMQAILKDINDILIKQRNFKSNIIKSCTYPACLLVMLLASFAVFIFFVQPNLARFQQMNTGQDVDVFSFGRYINIFVLIPLLAVGVYLFNKVFRHIIVSESGLNLPIFGAVVRYYNLSSFARLLAISYKSGIPVTQAILLSASSIPNQRMSCILLRCSAAITKKPIAKVFASTGFFAQDMIMKIESGDMTGNLDKVLYEISDAINLKLETAITSALKLLEPILMILIGCAVGYYGYILMNTVYGSLLSI